MIRVFPRRTRWTPVGSLTFVGDPPLFGLPHERLPVRVSCTFTWDKYESERLQRSWSRFYDDVQVGGPAYDDPGAEFVPGRFVKDGVVITSRGCIRNCSFCLVPNREGKLRELQITDGWNVADNNLLACSQGHIESVFDMLRRQTNPIEFSGGLDARLLKDWHVDLLKSIRVKFMFFACDSKQDLKSLERARKLLDSFQRQSRRCYVLIGWNGETPKQAEERLKEVFQLGFDPFAILFKPHDKDIAWPKEWRDLQRNWSRPAIYRKEATFHP